MKINLLPTSVSRGRSLKASIFIAVLLFVLSSIVAVGLVATSTSQVKAAHEAADEAKAAYDKTSALAASADTVVAQATQFISDINLVEAMDAHSEVYPKAYDSVLPYVPPFFRVYDISIVPVSDAQATITMNGVLKGQQQYVDLLLALLRIPGATGISRSEMPLVEPITPGVTPIDQVGRPHLPTDPTIPDDPMQRLNQMISKGGVTGYLGTGNFGSGQKGTRGAMPNYTAITVRFTIPMRLSAPDARATVARISGGGGGGEAAPAAAPAGPVGIPAGIRGPSVAPQGGGGGGGAPTGGSV